MFSNVVKNYLFFIFKYVVTVLLGFIATPLILKYIGQSRFGIYSLILEYLGYLAIADLGLSTTTNSLLNKAWGQGDRKLTILTIKRLAREYLKTVPVILVFVFVIYFALKEFSLKESFNSEVQTAFLIMAAGVFLIPFNIFKDFLIASGKTFIVSKATVFQLAILTTLNIVVTYYGFGLIGLAWVLLGANIFFKIIITAWSFREITKMPLKEEGGKAEFKNIWSFNFHALTQTIFGKLSYTTDAIILSFFHPPALVTNFILNQKLARLSDGLIQSVGNSSWAIFSKFGENTERRQNAFNLINKVFLLMSFPMLVTLAVYNEDFLNLWVGEGYFLSDAFTLVSFSNYLVFGAYSFWGWLFVSGNKVPALTSTIILSGVVNVIVSAIGAHYLGAIGPVIGTLVSFYGVYSWHMSHKMKVHLKLRTGNFIKDLTLLLISFGLLYPFRYSLKFFPAGDWWGLLANLAVLFPFCLVLTFGLIVRRSDIHKVMSILRKREKDS